MPETRLTLEQMEAYLKMVATASLLLMLIFPQLHFRTMEQLLLLLRVPQVQGQALALLRLVRAVALQVRLEARLVVRFLALAVLAEARLVLVLAVEVALVLVPIAVQALALAVGVRLVRATAVLVRQQILDATTNPA